VQDYHTSISDDCGDHVVVINTSDVALPGDEWKKRVYFHHTGYPGGATWTLAWELHRKDQTMVLPVVLHFRLFILVISLTYSP
jgi:large subunit ribosomal protein L13